MRRTKKLREWVFNPAFFSAQMLVMMVLGGLLASIFMRPWLAAGPVRLATYVVLGLASATLARRYISMVRRNSDGMATLLVVASCWVWIAFTATSIAIFYLVLASAWDLWPNWGENLTERFIYFFISGTAIGVAYKAITFESIPDEALMGRRVSAWPFNAFKRGEDNGNGGSNGGGDDVRQMQDDRTVRQDARDKRQDARDKRQDARSKKQNDREG